MARIDDIISLFRGESSKLIDSWNALYILSIEMADRGLIGQVDGEGDPIFGFEAEMFQGANADISPADFIQAIGALNYINSISSANRAALQKVRV